MADRENDHLIHESREEGRKLDLSDLADLLHPLAVVAMETSTVPDKIAVLHAVVAWQPGQSDVAMEGCVGQVLHLVWLYKTKSTRCVNS